MYYISLFANIQEALVFLQLTWYTCGRKKDCWTIISPHRYAMHCYCTRSRYFTIPCFIAMIIGGAKYLEGAAYPYLVGGSLLTWYATAGCGDKGFPKASNITRSQFLFQPCASWSLRQLVPGVVYFEGF